MTTTSIAATVVASATTASSSSKLVKLANGEYTAASVSADQADATKLGLVKEKDGNYGTKTPSTTTVASAAPGAAQSSAGVQSALLSLQLGGTD